MKALASFISERSVWHHGRDHMATRGWGFVADYIAFVRHSHEGNLEAALAAAERAAADERRRSVAALLEPDVGKVSAPSSRRF